jgi:hypothetical protein
VVIGLQNFRLSLLVPSHCTPAHSMYSRRREKSTCWMGWQKDCERALFSACAFAFLWHRRMQKVRRETTHSLHCCVCLPAATHKQTQRLKLYRCASEREIKSCVPKVARAGCKQAAKQEALHKFKLSFRLRVIKT